MTTDRAALHHNFFTRQHNTLLTGVVEGAILKIVFDAGVSAV